jgi:hypothetical protein
MVSFIRSIECESQTVKPLSGAGCQTCPKIFGPGVPQRWARRTPTLGQAHPDQVMRRNLTVYPGDTCLDGSIIATVIPLAPLPAIVLFCRQPPLNLPLQVGRVRSSPLTTL